MKKQIYTINTYSIETLLAWVKRRELVIPEIQKSFQWDHKKIKDFLDSLYQGIPIGTFIVWHKPDLKRNDGTKMYGKKVLLDGTQRLTALIAAIIGKPVVMGDWKRERITIAFHPIEQKFEIANTDFTNDPSWVPDLSQVFHPDFDLTGFVEEYAVRNPGIHRKKVLQNINRLQQIISNPVAMIEFGQEVDLETVIRIIKRMMEDSDRVNQLDLVRILCQINEEHNGPNLYKSIDYFVEIHNEPENYAKMADFDPEFSSTPFFEKMSWLENYQPLYRVYPNDLIRVAFTSQFRRAKISDLVRMLSGNADLYIYQEEIARESFAKLAQGILEFIAEENFKPFMKILQSAGFLNSAQFRANNVVNFCYILYLYLKKQQYEQSEIVRLVRRWFVLSVLTRRYNTSPDSVMERDLKELYTRPFTEVLEKTEQEKLSDAFWDVELVKCLDSTYQDNLYFDVFLAAQVTQGDPLFLYPECKLADHLARKWEISYLFSMEYLKKYGRSDSSYSQVANRVYLPAQMQDHIKNKPPKVYLQEAFESFDQSMMIEHLKRHCIPVSILEMDGENYLDFLSERRKLMAQKIKEYYYSL